MWRLEMQIRCSSVGPSPLMHPGMEMARSNIAPHVRHPESRLENDGRRFRDSDRESPKQKRFDGIDSSVNRFTNTEASVKYLELTICARSMI